NPSSTGLPAVTVMTVTFGLDFACVCPEADPATIPSRDAARPAHDTASTPRSTCLRRIIGDPLVRVKLSKTEIPAGPGSAPRFRGTFTTCERASPARAATAGVQTASPKFVRWSRFDAASVVAENVPAGEPCHITSGVTPGPTIVARYS